LGRDFSAAVDTLAPTFFLPPVQKLLQRLRRPFSGLLVALLAAAVFVGFAADVPSARKTVLVLGDSLAAGFGLNLSEAYPAVLQRKIDDAKLPYAVVNAGVSGDTTAGGLRRMDWLLRQPVDVLLLELGGNDGLRGLEPEATRSNLVAIIAKTRAKNPAAQVVLAGMEMPANMGEDYNAKFRRIFPEVAKEQDAALIPFLLEGVGGVPELNLPDQIHPTAKGHELVASNVWVVLEPLLRGREPSTSAAAAER
jgi:acyl-CoA thioesterase-1